MYRREYGRAGIHIQATLNHSIVLPLYNFSFTLGGQGNYGKVEFQLHSLFTPKTFKDNPF